jgi:hypothetical protein
MRDKIQFAITCGPRSEPFLKLLLHSIEATESGDFDLEYLIAINNNAVDIEKIKRIESKHLKVLYISPPEQMYNGLNEDLSRSHGRSLDELVSGMTSKYGVICDVDVAFLSKNWDRKIVNLLSPNKIISGSTYRRSVRNGSIYKYSNFPCVFMSVFLVEQIQSLNISYVPTLEKLTVDDSNVHIYGEPSGREIMLDTGYQIPEKIISAGYSGIPLETVCHGFPNSVFTKHEDLGDEFLLNGEPIATHKGRAWSRGISSSWERKVLEWLEK